MISGSFADGVPSFMLGGYSFCELRGAPPEGICGSPEKHDSKTNTRSGRLHCNGVGNQGQCGDYENDWSERISRYAVRANGIRRALSTTALAALNMDMRMATATSLPAPWLTTCDRAAAATRVELATPAAPSAAR